MFIWCLQGELRSLVEKTVPCILCIGSSFCLQFVQEGRVELLIAFFQFGQKYLKEFIAATGI